MLNMGSHSLQPAYDLVESKPADVPHPPPGPPSAPLAGQPEHRQHGPDCRGEEGAGCSGGGGGGEAGAEADGRDPGSKPPKGSRSWKQMNFRRSGLSWAWPGTAKQLRRIASHQAPTTPLPAGPARRPAAAGGGGGGARPVRQPQPHPRLRAHPRQPGRRRGRGRRRRHGCGGPGGAGADVSPLAPAGLSGAWAVGGHVWGALGRVPVRPRRRAGAGPAAAAPGGGLAEGGRGGGRGAAGVRRDVRGPGGSRVRGGGRHAVGGGAAKRWSGGRAEERGRRGCSTGTAGGGCGRVDGRAHEGWHQWASGWGRGAAQRQWWGAVPIAAAVAVAVAAAGPAGARAPAQTEVRSVAGGEHTGTRSGGVISGVSDVSVRSRSSSRHQRPRGSRRAGSAAPCRGRCGRRRHWCSGRGSRGGPWRRHVSTAARFPPSQLGAAAAAARPVAAAQPLSPHDRDRGNSAAAVSLTLALAITVSVTSAVLRLWSAGELAPAPSAPAGVWGHCGAPGGMGRSRAGGCRRQGRCRGWRRGGCAAGSGPVGAGRQPEI